MRLVTYLALFAFAIADHRYDHQEEDEDEEIIILDEDEQKEEKKLALQNYLESGYEGLIEVLQYADMTNDGQYDEWELNYAAGEINDDFGIDEEFARAQLELFPDDGYTWTDAVWITDTISAPFSVQSTDANLLLGHEFKTLLEDVFFEYDDDVLEDLVEDVFFVFDEDEDD